MALTGKVQGAAPGLLGFDCNTPVTAKVAQAFVAQGYSFCVRYLSRTTQGKSDLSAAEANIILDGGLALMAVQHVRKPGWEPTGDLGTQDGAAAAKNAASIGFPAGVNIWCDLEGVKKGTTAQAVTDYCNNWFNEVSKAGFAPGLYVGDSCILDDGQLMALKFQHYWRSQSNVPNVRSRGYQMIQLFPEVTKNGTGIDIDVTQGDYKKGQVQWLARAAKAAKAGAGS